MDEVPIPRTKKVPFAVGLCLGVCRLPILPGRRPLKCRSVLRPALPSLSGNRRLTLSDQFLFYCRTVLRPASCIWGFVEPDLLPFLLFRVCSAHGSP